MNEDDARHLLLVRAVASADASEMLLTREGRQAATASALAATGDGSSGRRRDQRFLASRSAFAFSRLVTRFPAGQALAATRWPGWIDWALPLAALILGFAINEIDGGGRLNIIAFPLFGILAWNIVVYLVIALHAAGRLIRPRPAERAPSLLARALGGVSGVARRNADPHQPLGLALARFVRDWAGIRAR